MDQWQKLDLLVGYLGLEETLESLIKALGSSISNEHLDYIMRMHDLDLTEDGEDGESYF